MGKYREGDVISVGENFYVCELANEEKATFSRFGDTVLGDGCYRVACTPRYLPENQNTYTIDNGVGCTSVETNNGTVRGSFSYPIIGKLEKVKNGSFTFTKFYLNTASKYFHKEFWAQMIKREYQALYPSEPSKPTKKAKKR